MLPPQWHIADIKFIYDEFVPLSHKTVTLPYLTSLFSGGLSKSVCFAIPITSVLDTYLLKTILVKQKKKKQMIRNTLGLFVKSKGILNPPRSVPRPPTGTSLLATL